MKSLSQLNAYSTSTVVYVDETLGGGQVLANRYQINGLLDTAKPVLENIELMTNAGGSWLSYDIHEGKWGVVINQTSTSVASFDDSNIIGNISLSGTGLRDLYNSVKVEFPNRDLKDSADFIQDEIPDVDRNANEVDNVLNITYDIINDPVQAELLGLLELKQSRVDLVISFRTDFTYVNLKAGDVVNITNDRYSFVNKPFRIITIAEIQDDDGALQMEITALEYNDDVYVADLYKYTRSDLNGIITIGSIGKPGTPQVTKFEQASRPRVLIESLAPTGIVEGMEFWLSTDVAEADDDLRSYRLIATRRPINGGTFSSGDNITLDYDSLGDTNFVIKTRGVNSTTVGQYSDPSGFVYFAPVQTTDAIGVETALVDPTTGLILSLGANYLLKKLFDMATSTGTTSTSSIYEWFNDLFKENTGVDLEQEAQAGGLTPQTLPYITVKDEGNLLTDKVDNINFVGNGVVATKSGNSVTVTIGSQTNPGDGTTVVIDSACGVKEGDVPMWNGEKWTTSAECCDPAPSVCEIKYIDIIQKYPPDRTTYQDPITQLTSDTAPITGNYYLRYGGRTLYGPLTKGTGNAKLYKSDGTLVSTVAASSSTIDKNLVAIPFTGRELGTDYYVILDEGFVAYCDAVSRKVDDPITWNFNTPLYSTDAYTASGDNPTFPTQPIVPGGFLSFIQYQTVSGTYMKANTDPCDPGFTVGTGRSTPTFDVIKNEAGSTLIKTPGQINTGFKNGDIIHIPARNVGANSGIITVTVTDACNGNIVSFSNDAIPDLKVGPCSKLLIPTSIKGAGGTGTIMISAGTSTYTIGANSAVDYAGRYLNYGVLTGKVSLGQSHTVELPAAGIKPDPAADVDCYLSSVPSSGKLYDNMDVIAALTLTNFVVSSSPVIDTNNTKVNPQTNIALYFNETVILGDSGTITLYRADGTTHQAFDVTTSYADDKTSEIIWCSDNVVYLNPTKDLNLKTTYYIQASSGSVKSHCVSWGGISDTTSVRFSTDPGPTLTSTSQATSSTSTQFVNYQYDRTVVPNTGNLRIYDSSNNLVKQVSGTDTAVIIT